MSGVTPWSPSLPPLNREKAVLALPKRLIIRFILHLLDAASSDRCLLLNHLEQNSLCSASGLTGARASISPRRMFGLCPHHTTRMGQSKSVLDRPQNPDDGSLRKCGQGAIEATLIRGSGYGPT